MERTIRKLHFLAGVLFSVVALYLALRGVHWGAVGDAVRGADFGLLALAVPSVRHDLVGRGHSKLNRVTGGRANLVTGGLHIAADHPAGGIGVGGFGKAYAKRRGVKGRNPKRVASHTTPVTVAAEEGVVGLVLFGWLLTAALVATLVARRRSRVAFAAGLVLLAVAVQSLFYNAFFEDPIT